ncbi:uncharacterized protein [Musca autumnalis]|uniref:uncharacterized protein n=1 Tax=Musca autumnalis TaxID=221902 RepID=UPI003CEB8023
MEALEPTDTCSVTDPALFGNCLQDLSITELLVLQRSLDKVTLMEPEPEENRYSDTEAADCQEMKDGKCKKPTTLALMAESRGYVEPSHPGGGYAPSHPGGGYAPSHHESWQEEKPSKLQILFQISVTALSFLSFGGYLLCLIVQSIKSKGTTYFHPMASTAATMTNVKRIKVYRRSRRSSLPPVQPSAHYNNNNYWESANPYQYYYKENN